MTLLRSFTQSFFLVPVLSLWRYSAQSSALRFLLTYTVASTRNIFCLIKSFWLCFDGRPSWPFVLDEIEYNLHPKDPDLTTLIPPTLRKKFVKILCRTGKFICPARWAAGCCSVPWGVLPWRELATKGAYSCLYWKPPCPPSSTWFCHAVVDSVEPLSSFCVETLLSLGSSPRGWEKSLRP